MRKQSTHSFFSTNSPTRQKRNSQSMQSDSANNVEESAVHNPYNESTSATNIIVDNCSYTNQFHLKNSLKKNEKKFSTGPIVIGNKVFPDSFSSSSISSASTFVPATMADSSTKNGAIHSVAYKQYSKETRRARNKSEMSASISSASTASIASATFNEQFSHALDFIFHKIGLFATDYSKTILTIIFIISAICSLKIPFTPQQDDIKTGYTPNGAQSHVETMLYNQFYRNITTQKNITYEMTGEVNDPISVVVFVVAKDGGTVLRETHLNETVWVADELATKFRITGKNFYEFCTDFCQLNEPIRQFKNGFIFSNRQYNNSLNTRVLADKNSEFTNNGVDKTKNDFSSNRINLTFPFISILGFKFDMSPHFFGVQTYDTEDSIEKLEPVTRYQYDEFGLNMKFIKLIVLQFRAEKPFGATKEDVTKWERSLAEYLPKGLNSKYVQTYVLSVTVVGDEIVRTGMTLFPYIFVGFIIMSVFSIVTVYLSAFYYDQWTIHKVLLALWAGICPLLATSSALGFLFWFGFRFGTILAVSPFLVMAIGVDDAYLMIHSWQRICVEKLRLKHQKRRKHQLTTDDKKLKNNLLAENQNEDKDDLRERIAEVLVDVGPSITITSLTNVFAFVIGIFSPTPEIQLFCAGNATAILFDYVYQLFMFTPIIAIAGGFEIKMEQSKLEKAAQTENGRKQSGFRPLPSSKPLDNRQTLENKLTLFMSRYCQWLANGFTAVFVFLALIVYWHFSLKGALNINVNITPKKLFLSDSPINDINVIRDNYILSNYTTTSVFVNNVGNLSDPAQLQRIRQLIADYEAIPNCLGKKFTHFWLRDFENYVESMNEVEEESDSEVDNKASHRLNGLQTIRMDELRSFLNWPEYKHWGGFVRFNETDFQLKKFFAVIAYHGADLLKWHRRGELLTTWREIAKNYTDLEAWVWADDAQFLDQIETLIPATIQSSVATLFCMIIVCALFMSNLFTVVVATLSIVSICIGVFGFLSHWSIDLDPIFMATTIMSISFSVDFPAHVTYHYYRGGIDNEMNLRPEERIYQSLIAIGFPLLQCGISTILFVLCLLFVDTYMSEVFVKTMVMVVSLGLLHGLFVVPTFLCALSNVYELMCKTQKKFHRVVRNLGNGVKITNLIYSTKPAIKIRRRLSKNNIAKISIPEISPA